MRMFASISINEWKDKYLTEGIKAGDVDGVTGDNIPVILVQSRPFPLGTKGDKCKIVVFDKLLSEIYVDWDDDVEAFELLPDGEKSATYEGIDEGLLKGMCMYGSYVKEIKSKEITSIHNAEWTTEDDWIIISNMEGLCKQTLEPLKRTFEINKCKDCYYYEKCKEEQYESKKSIKVSKGNS